MATPSSSPRRRASGGGGLRGWVHRLRSQKDAADEAIVTELYHQYHRPLLTFVMRLTAGDRQWAEDVVQETMIRAWRSVDQLDTEAASLMPWLATVARRIVIDDRRRKEARPREAGEAPLENVQIPDDVEDLLRTVVVTEALKALTPAHREVLTETILRDRSVNEAAAVLGVPVGTVKSRVYYALRALRVALEERGVSTR
jgi:RNA polymerase sigma-70 factor (ECF subfamily)